MAAFYGLFDPELRAAAWFDDDNIDNGWFDRESIFSIVYEGTVGFQSNATFNPPGYILVSIVAGFQGIELSGASAIVLVGACTGYENQIFDMFNDGFIVGI